MTQAPGRPGPTETAISREDDLITLQAQLVKGHFTAIDIILLSIYPLTLLLGFCFSIGHSNSYFAHSHNIFNLVFVKNGWLWTSTVFWYHIYRLPVSGRSKQQAAIRWAIATLLWMVVTQWAFGAPLTDRTMIWTGGVCELAKKGVESDINLGETTGKLAAMTNKACKEMHGHWEGGHDLSGHVFILTHSSLFIWYEILPILVQESSLLNDNATKAAFALLAGWWWMLLMTAAYFHTWREKLTGLLTGLIGWLLVYKLAPQKDQLRNILGVPRV